MRERINRLAKGIVDTELPKLFLSPESIEETLGNNTIYKREVFLSSENSLHIKGLAYSDNARVRILNGAFGGLRNHIGFEVDTSYCESGDTIGGFLYLVTNSGERKVPFLFHVEMTASVKVLTQLKTVEDFVELAGKDMELALRLMEYRDFTEAPFLQDMKVRTVFGGLKGHGNRQNSLEEFFLALDVKEPIELTLSAAKKTYENPTAVLSDKIVLRKNTWGYIYIEVKADGEFIEIPKRVITQADFDAGRCDLIYKIHPERMHKGKNLGAIRLLTAHGETAVRVEAMGDTTVDITGREHEISKAGICRYLNLRLDLASGLFEREALLDKLQNELDAIRGAGGGGLLLSLLQSDLYQEADRAEQSCLTLDECRDEMLDRREEKPELYCYYQYLQSRTKRDGDQKESLLRILQKRAGEETDGCYLYLLLLKAEPKISEDRAALYEVFRKRYANGCHSPFLYLAACRLLLENPELLHSMDRFEIHALYFAAKRGMIGEELAGRIAGLASSAKFFHKLYYRTLAILYGKYPGKEILSAVCCLLIKGNCRTAECFPWYEKGVEQEISLTRLYEYFLYSLPKDYEKQLPKQVLLYFSYEHNELDRHNRSVLYKNILLYLDKDSELYRTYEREIEKFAMDQLFLSRINSRLAVIYKHMIYRDIIDAQVAKVLPGILRANRISCKDRAMKYVVVCNEALTGEDAYPIADGVAYVPLFFDDCVLLFQDMYGNRYMDVEYTKEPVMDEPELEARCFEMYPGHPMLRMRSCQEIMKKEKITEEEVLVLQKALDELPLKPLYQQKMLTKIVSYYKERLLDEDARMEGQGGEYLLRLNKKALPRAERAGVCETLISQDYFLEAYQMIREFGDEGVRTGRLYKLCSKMILQKLFAEDDLLLHLAYRVFSEGKGDSVILDYLCEHYNGTNEAMYRILIQAIKEHVETYDLEERLLAQLLFTGDGRHLDTVFDFYASRKKTSDNIVKAYFTVKCVDYFLKDAVPGDKVFAWLEGALSSSPDMTKVPEIYLLALSKFYASMPSLNGEQQELCKKIMTVLTNDGMVFAYFKKLAKYTEAPGDIADKEIIEYHGLAKRPPILKVRILPDEEDFHTEGMRMVYKGIYTAQKLLFEGEILEYQIFEEADGEPNAEPKKAAEGEIACAEVPAGDKKNRFSRLNEMGLYLGTRDGEKLKECLKNYIEDDLTVEKLFPQM